MNIITDLEKLNTVIKGLDLMAVDYIIKSYLHEGERCWSVELVQKAGD